MNKHIFAFLLLIFTAKLSIAQTATEDRNVKIKVPTEWIEKLRNYDFKQNNKVLLEDFEGFIAPDSLVGSKEYSHLEGGILNPMFVDLDSDSEQELIGLFGWNENEPTLAVFKKMNESWYLLYTEPFYMFYKSPELQVANNFSKNKTFFIRWLYERGSGVYRDSYHFYKLIDNKVYHCLELTNKAHIFGWGLLMNQDVEMNFNFNCSSSDDLWVTYDYNFTPCSVFKKDDPYDGHPDIPFVKGNNSVGYNWDPTTYTYRPDFANHLEDYLNEDKIACFREFGNDTLFVKAFDYELKQTLTNGTSKQKKYLKAYLDIVKKEQKANILVEDSDTTIYATENSIEKFPIFTYKNKSNKEGVFEFYRDNLKYPQTEDCCMGMVYIKFVLEKNATLTNIKIYRGIPGCNEYNNEALRLVHLMNGLWTPAIRNNKKVRYLIIFPIQFHGFESEEKN